jgi:hypothetical protein
MRGEVFVNTVVLVLTVPMTDTVMLSSVLDSETE